MRGVCASWTAGLRLTSSSRRKSPTLGALGPAISREGRGRGRRGGNANFQNPLPLFADVPVLFSDKFQQSMKFKFMVPQTQFIDDVWTLSLCNRARYVVFLVQKTVVVPQLQFFTGRQHPLLAANADPHGPVCPADHGDSTVAAYFGRRCSCCRVVQILRCCRGEALGAPTVAARREICGFLRPLVSDSHLFGVRVCLWRTRIWIFREMTPGMVSVLNTPRFDSGHNGVSLRGFLEEFHTPLYLAVTCTVFGVRLWSTRVWIFWEMTPGLISVLNTPRFDSGYIYGVSLRCLLEEFPSYFNSTLCLVQQWIQVYASVYVAGLPSHDAPRAVFLRCPQAPDARHHGRYGPEGQFYARFLVALRCRVVVKVSLLVVLVVLHGTALCR